LSKISLAFHPIHQPGNSPDKLVIAENCGVDFVQHHSWALPVTLDYLKNIQYIVCMINFEWDKREESANVKRHGVSFQEAKSVFYDEFAIQFFDGNHSIDEERFLLLGMSANARVLLVCHCERAGGEVIRLISARKATKRENMFYKGGEL
jgi:hypothetical protein